MSKEKFIRSTIREDELLAGLAEEAAELSQAALKYRRALTGYNPTPLAPKDARAALLEEIADVELYLSILGFYKDKRDINTLADHTRSKLTRWVKRLQDCPPKQDHIDVDDINVAKVLASIIKSEGKKKVDLSAEAGVHTNTIHRWLQGTSPSFFQLTWVLGALGKKLVIVDK